MRYAVKPSPMRSAQQSLIATDIQKSPIHTQKSPIHNQYSPMITPHIPRCVRCPMTPSIVMHVARNHISACIYVCKMNNDRSIRESSSGVFVKEKNKNIVRDEGKRQKNVNAIWIARSDIGILVVVVFYIENLVVGWRLRMHSTFRCAVHGNGLQWVAVCDSASWCGTVL